MYIQLGVRVSQGIQMALRVMAHHLGEGTLADDMDVVRTDEFSTVVQLRFGGRRFKVEACHQCDQDFENPAQLFEGDQFIRCYFFDLPDVRKIQAMPDGRPLGECTKFSSYF